MRKDTLSYPNILYKLSRPQALHVKLHMSYSSTLCGIWSPNLSEGWMIFTYGPIWVHVMRQMTVMSNRDASLFPGNVSVNVLLNIRQPVLSRGQLHWALNNVASYRTPGCTALLSDLYDERTQYLSSQEVQPGNNTVDYSLQQSASSAEKPQVQANAHHKSSY